MGMSEIIDARIAHVRHENKRYALSHRQWYLHVDLDDLDGFTGPLLGYNRRAVVSLRDRDYGNGTCSLRAWLTEALATARVPLPGGRISLLTMPRVGGLFFNPVSFWLCRDEAGDLRVVLAEVSNTFGGRHCYVCRREDGGIIDGKSRIRAEKVFYVSPFLTVDGDYTFRFHETAGTLGVFITLTRAGNPVLFASIAGRRTPLTKLALAARLLKQPLPAWRVLALIHVHALWLYLKGIPLVRRLAKPSRPVTVTRSTTTIAPETSHP